VSDVLGPLADSGGPTTLARGLLDVSSWAGLDWEFWLTAVAAGITIVASLTAFVATAIGKIKRWSDQRRDPRRTQGRGRFADHIDSQLRRLDEKEEWRHYRFARLEAEVEMEGSQRRSLSSWRFLKRNALRRVKSLSRALQRSDERLILLEGEPGAGKSVTLRNAARAMAGQVKDNPNVSDRIPLYVNLKELRPVDGRLDSETVRAFVLDQLNRANSRDVEEFLSEEFTLGMRQGTWLFLFDSFDEIPEILTATESDETVGRYADVLYDFLHGMNISRGVIASREFKGPRRFGWPRFTVQRLTQRQKRELIRKADLEPAAEAEVHAALASSDPMVTQLSGNPMLLGLLCEHVRTTRTFPASSHTVFETFVHSRLSRDRRRIERRYAVDPVELRQVAEEIAFRLTAQPGSGLSPSRAEVAELLGDIRIGAEAVDPSRLDRYLDALEYIKLAQAPEGVDSGAQRPFTFAHRRFQEYFATCVVIREPDRVPVDTLLLDGRWRETAVALLQTQSCDAVSAALVAKADQMLARCVETVEAAVEAAVTSTAPLAFEWPPNSLHLLGLLDMGFAGRPTDVPESLRSTVSTLLRAAWASRRRHHQLWSVQATLLAETPVAETLLEESFASRSMLLRGAAYRYAGRLPSVPPPLSRHMRIALIDQAAQGRLLVDWPAVRAQLSRLSEPAPQLSAARLLRWSPIVTGLLVTIAFLSGALIDGAGGPGRWFGRWWQSMVFTGLAWGIAAWVLRMAARKETAVKWTAIAGLHGLLAFLALFFAVELKAGQPLGPALLVEVGQHWDSVWLVFGVLAGYVVCWPASAVTAVAWGLDVRGSRWPFLPFAVVATAFVTLLRTGRRRSSRKMVELVARLGVVILAMGAGALFVFTPGADVVLLGIFGVPLLMLSVLILFHAMRAERADRRHLKSVPRQATLDQTALRQLTGRLRSDRGLRLLVDLIRRRRLDCTDDSIIVFDDLIMIAEQRRAADQRKPTPSLSLSSWRGYLHSLWEALPGRPSDGYIPDWTLDEIARLIVERTDLTTTPDERRPGATRQGPAGDDDLSAARDPARSLGHGSH
jgi:hypothetical protein